MYPIKETRIIKTSMGPKIKNICVSKDGKEIAYWADAYYYITKSNSVSSRRVK